MLLTHLLFFGIKVKMVVSSSVNSWVQSPLDSPSLRLVIFRKVYPQASCLDFFYHKQKGSGYGIFRGDQEKFRWKFYGSWFLALPKGKKQLPFLFGFFLELAFQTPIQFKWWHWGIVYYFNKLYIIIKNIYFQLTIFKVVYVLYVCII